jgi:hypothetical protein
MVAAAWTRIGRPIAAALLTHVGGALRRLGQMGRAVTVGLMAGTAQASSPAEAKCEAQAAEKKLAGAAKNSFVKKCVTDAGGTPAPAPAKAPDPAEVCEKSAADKKLAGAARTSHIKKCVADSAAKKP